MGQLPLRMLHNRRAIVPRLLLQKERAEKIGPFFCLYSAPEEGLEPPTR